MDRRSLLERDREVEASTTALGRAVSGEGGVLSLVGPAGIGKSGLLAELEHHAVDSGVEVLRARGTALERDFAFGIARQLLEPAVTGVDESERAELFEGAARLAAPLLSIPIEGPPAPPSLDPSHATLHGLYWLTSNLASRRPLLIAVDDVHWADPESLRWLVHLAARLEGVPALLAIAARVPEPGIKEPLLDTLLEQASSARISPPPLSREAVVRLASERLREVADQAFADACHAATGGNPFLTHALLEALSSEGVRPVEANTGLVSEMGPDTVARSVLGRIGRLPEDCMRLVEALAVAGDGSPLSIVAELGELGVREAGDAADALSKAAILARGERLEFAHPIVAAAVRSDLPPRRRQRMHRESAQLVAEGGGESGRVAAHLLAVEPADDAWVAEQLVQAGAEAIPNGAMHQAADYLTRALAETGPGADPVTTMTALSLLGWVEAVLNREELAVEHLREALALATDPTQRAMIANGLSSALVAQRRYVEAYEVLEPALAGIDEAFVEIGLRLEGELCVARGLSREVRTRIDARTKRFPARPGVVASGLQMGTDALAVLLEGGTAADGVRIATEALFEGRLIAEETADSPALYSVIVALFLADALEVGRDACEQAVAEASARGSLRARAAALCWRGAFNYRLGRIAEAEADSRAAMEGELPPLLIPVNLAHLAEALRERGELDEAQALLGTYDIDAEDPGGELLLNFFRFARARLRLDRHQVEAGLDDLRRHVDCERAWDLAPGGGLQMQWRCVLADFHRSRGEHEKARRLATEDLENARAFGALRPLGIAQRTLGAAKGGEEGIALLSESLGTFEAAGTRLEQARAFVELGSALRADRRPSEAREPLREGLELARRCGGLVLAERAFEELQATGARPRKILRVGVDALTASERRVARMAAAGRANREIAQELFVTVRTVETHLRHVYQKLEISSRGELEGVLEER